MFVKIHSSQGQNLLAVCDEDILGKSFSEGEMCITISETFYKGDQRNEEEVIDLLKEFANFNLVGSETIALALKENVINQDNIICIEGVPHATVATC